MTETIKPYTLVDWPLPLAPELAWSHCGACHSLGCNAHSSHMLLWGHLQSEVAECPPINRKHRTGEKIIWNIQYIARQGCTLVMTRWSCVSLEHAHSDQLQLHKTKDEIVQVIDVKYDTLCLTEWIHLWYNYTHTQTHTHTHSSDSW